MKTQIAATLARFAKLLQADVAADRKRACRRGDVLESGHGTLKMSEQQERSRENRLGVVSTVAAMNASVADRGLQQARGISTDAVSNANRVLGLADRFPISLAGEAGEAAALSASTGRAIDECASRVDSNESSELRTVVDGLLQVPREA